MRIVLPTTYRFEAKSERTKGEAHTLFPGLRKHPPNLSPSLSANSTHKNERTRAHTHTFSHFSSFPAPCEPFLPCPPEQPAFRPSPALLYTATLSPVVPLTSPPLPPAPASRQSSSNAFPSSLLQHQLSYWRAPASSPASVIISEMLSTAGLSQPMDNCREMRVTQWQFQVFGV